MKNKPTLLFLLLLGFLITVADTAMAQSAQRTKIRVGLIEYPGFCYKDTDSIYRGIDVELTYKIVQIMGSDVEIVPCSYSATKLLHMLNEGEIDVAGDIMDTPDRRQHFLYSEQEEGHSYCSVYVNADDKRFLYGDIEQLQKMTYGCEKSVAVRTVFISWCKKYGFVPNIKTYDSYEEVNRAIARREIDAGIIGAETVEGYRIIQKFTPMPYYYLFTKDDVLLKNKFDSALEQLLQKDPLYEQKLYNKYMTAADVGIEAFTHDETKYIHSASTIRVAMVQNNAPFFSMNKGKCNGIIPDYYAHLSDVTGLRFSFLEYENEDKAIAAVLDGECEVLGLTVDDLVTTSQKGLHLTTEYTVLDAALVTKNSCKKVRSVAVNRKNERRISTKIVQQKSLMSLVICPSTDACFEWLQKNKADAVITSIPAAVWHINQHNVSQHALSAMPEINWSISGAVNKHDAVLCSILDKAITISESQMQSIISTNTLQEQTLKSVIERIPPLFFAIFALVMFTMLIIVTVTSMLLHKRHVEAALVERMKQENARKEAELAAVEKNTEEKNVFFSNISHDMRTPLNAIIGFSELAMKEPMDKKEADYLSKIQLSGKLLLDLINDTLTISKINSGKITISTAPVDTDTLINSIVIPIREIAAKKNIEFTVDLTQMRQREIVADVLNLQKIFLNLLTNAIKYTPRGGHVFFKVAFDETAALETTAIVRDDGIGMSSSFLPHLFEPFTQEHRYVSGDSDNSTLSIGGTGLGLSIVKRLVDLMGGTIDVETEVNKGTTFTLHFHFELVPEVPTIKKETEQQAVKTNLAGKKVLVCEDNMLNREIIQAILEEWQMKVVTAENGKQGVELFAASAENEFAVVLMDLRMPEMNGYEAAIAIRRLKREDVVFVPIVALTADVFDNNAQKCYDSGMNAHVAKPVDQQKLHDTLCRLIVR